MYGGELKLLALRCIGLTTVNSPREYVLFAREEVSFAHTIC